MKIELYPTFNSVFIDEQLKGIFFPLCSIELNDENQTKLFFVSSNSVFTNEENKSDDNNNIFTKFSLVDNKYNFNGNIELYKGYKTIKEIFKILETDFAERGNQYLENKTKSKEYINKIKSKISVENLEFDLDYYLQKFYEFSINKLNYQINKVFEFIHINDDFGEKLKMKSQIVEDVDEGCFGDIEINAEYLFPKNINLEEYEKAGQMYDFFVDGLVIVLLYNRNDNTVLNINNYS